MTHPENNGVEEEDEFEEYVGESVAVADLVVAGHGASVGFSSGSPLLTAHFRIDDVTAPGWMDRWHFYLKVPY